jgi:hypothetical protein
MALGRVAALLVAMVSSRAAQARSVIAIRTDSLRWLRSSGG